MCVACALHEQGRHKNFWWQARDFGRSRPPCHLSIHFCGVVTYCRHTFVSGCHRSRKRVLRRWVYVSEVDVVTSPCMCVHIEKELETKNLSPGSSKKQPSTGKNIDASITPVAPNFNVVLGSAEHYEQKWLFFLKAAVQIIQSTTLNWGTGGDMTCMVLNFIGLLFFWRTRYWSGLMVGHMQVPDFLIQFHPHHVQVVQIIFPFLC